MLAYGSGLRSGAESSSTACLHRGRHKQLTEFAAKERERKAATATEAVGPSPVAALVTANVTGSAPPAVAAVTPQAFEQARRNLTEAVAPSVSAAHDPRAISLVPAEDNAGPAEAELAPTSAATDVEDKHSGPGVASSPCSPSSPPGVGGEAPQLEASSLSESAGDTRDAEGFLVDENYAKEQLRDAVVDVPPPTAAEGS
eukprot:COSAG02_NODE_1900_length_10458_cov_4.285838_10_plen_200_part_00